ncbi:hypothetical protein GOB10_18450 [Sinorhizobium meliloti]|uniref:hypothetical protein n=1 Tax=Rhizobium meliloti TaxID=382 RepID=UPI00299E6E12|nr:hypothetical protein [Sinorhizobium meliloti]MDW9897729.1 hypothetical protein [Sinorhizobium meliloti]MDX0345438.1 hypothetical protein [Sinorhizobium meliloti]MDX0856768.1 hypothetical protein [Sinorhizobium medicae]MDX1211769.1 hypothetical protein [Sinorhizobium medicae]
MGYFANRKVKVLHEDLLAAGVVRSRYDQFQKIKKGILPPPHKDGDTMQSTAWWWAEEIDAAIEREKAERQVAAE